MKSGRSNELHNIFVMKASVSYVKYCRYIPVNSSNIKDKMMLLYISLFKHRISSRITIERSLRIKCLSFYGDGQV